MKLGYIGMGGRGCGLMKMNLQAFDYTDVIAVCDLERDRADKAAGIVKDLRGHDPAVYTDYELLLKEQRPDLIVCATSWHTHFPIAIASMRAGIPVAIEVGGACSVEECWELVRVYEETGTPIMMLENCCFGKEELLVTNMVRKGLMGEVVYCHGAYGHDLSEGLLACLHNKRYRGFNYINRNGDDYPTHDLGPIARLLNINRGNRMVKLTSQASKARGMHERALNTETLRDLADIDFRRGDIVITTITCADGSMITLQLDTTLPRAYSREFTVRGTKGLFQDPGHILLTTGKGFDHNRDMNEYLNTMNEFEEYLPPIWKDVTPEQLSAGHGGMDYFEFKVLFECLMDGKPLPIDVYDTVSWAVITVLSEISVANGGMPVDVPDFTRGNWVFRSPEDVVEMK